ncbi:MAG: amidinotransferase [Marinoscillum sp.]|nr:amidinotransferase [Marinoscillum sp.]OUX27031.1 MAG: amidinotransferase [Flammeovirgaceae bacterium TMED262]|tara:strand:+ start:11094 stop:12038 length:945 start_codon:yes stop_codon:yes gene_type:complete
MKKIKKQITNNLIMIRPKHFNFNIETAENNHFQKKDERLSNEKILKKATSEFDKMVLQLLKNKIDVTVFDDKKEIVTTDSVFPNNWISFHQNGLVFIYPMFSENRRKEKRKDILEKLDDGYEIKKIIDFSSYEMDSVFLEGTGSMILDRQNRICYASLSERTNKIAIKKFCEKALYTPIIFKSYQKINDDKSLIYHTNVMMCVAEEYVLICLDSVHSEDDKNNIISTIKNTQKEIIEISEKQCNSFAGNMLQVTNKINEKFLIMSSSAYNSLEKEQRIKLLKYNKIIHSDLSLIEKLGGGSARCMIAENFLQKK